MDKTSTFRNVNLPLKCTRKRQPSTPKNSILASFAVSDGGLDGDWMGTGWGKGKRQPSENVQKREFPGVAQGQIWPKCQPGKPARQGRPKRQPSETSTFPLNIAENVNLRPLQLPIWLIWSFGEACSRNVTLQFSGTRPGIPDRCDSMTRWPANLGGTHDT